MAEKRGRRLRAPASRTGTETIDIRTSDAWSLRADVFEPVGPPVGTVVLAHAAMARRSSFDRPRGFGIARFFVLRGWRVVAFDFRGHGDSGRSGGQGATWRYDDLVARDLPAVFSYAQSRAEPGTPMVAVGHSLGGHVALAAQGTGRVRFDSIVGVGANIWLRELEPSRLRWLVKRASLKAAVALSRRAGRFPARALGAGSDDESLDFFEDLERFSRSGWRSRDGQEDYSSVLARVRCRTLQVVSDGDPFVCVPECGERFIARSGGEHIVERIRKSDDEGPPPTHMGMVTGGRIASVWGRVEGWMRASIPN